MSEDLVSNMRARVDQCRRLADMITNATVRDSLRNMANEIEADMKQIAARTEAANRN